jgi:hypothetical protein
MQGKKLLINTMLMAKLIERGITKLGPIVTSNTFQVVGMIIVEPQSQDPKVLKHFILAFQEENPRVTRTQEGLTMSIWSNYPGCLVITLLTREWDLVIILP